MSEHTKLPWRFAANDCFRTPRGEPEVALANIYADGRKVVDDIDLVDAEFIVRAVNAHDDLVAALRDITDAGTEAWGEGRPCVQRALSILAALAPPSPSPECRE